MKRLKTILLMSSGIIVFLLVGWGSEVVSRNGFGPAPGGSGRQTHAPPVPHPVVPPSQFSNKWSVTEVINSFQGNGLKIANIKPVTDEDYSSLPAKPKEGIKFSIQSLGEDVAGCILSFDVKYDLEKVRKHYLSLNKKNKLHSWTFVKDNILLVLDGTLHEERARKYERALYDLKK